MFEEPKPSRSSGSAGRVLVVVIVLVAAAAAGLVAWRPSLVGLGSAPEPAVATKPPTKTSDAPPPSAKPDKNQVGVLETTAGTIVIEFLPEYAPTHTLVFQNLIRTGFFDGTLFHRVLPKRAVQGGGPNSKDDNPYDDGLVLDTQRRIPSEITPKIKHTRGVVSAAHADGDMDSATSQFFISTGSDPAWDGKYTIFARVIRGMEIVDTMAAAPLHTDDARLRDRPVDPVRITKAYLAPREEALAKRS